MNIASIFNATARNYDATRKKYISCFDDLYGVAVEQIPYKKTDSFKVLDLGAGTGLFSERVRNKFPSCEITLTDISNEMLDKARERFHGDEQTRFIAHDYVSEIIPGEFNVVISALSLHHSTQNELRTVFSKIFSCLGKDGIFINADQILGETPEIENVYEKMWLEQALSNGCTSTEIDVAITRMGADKTCPLSTQLSLLKKEGFTRVNCWYQYYRYAVYSGVKR